MNALFTSLKMFLSLTLLTGIIYPLCVTLVAELAMHKQARGSLIQVNGKVVGSELIGQHFKSDGYFWSRPSAIDYDPMKPSGGSNLGPTSLKLKELVAERLKGYPVDAAKVPAELVYASGSGLDPHISPSAAYFQMDRIAKARSLDPNKIKELIDHNTSTFFGVRYVNVLLLNQALGSVHE